MRHLTAPNRSFDAVGSHRRADCDGFIGSYDRLGFALEQVIARERGGLEARCPAGCDASGQWTGSDVVARRLDLVGNACRRSPGCIGEIPRPGTRTDPCPALAIVPRESSLGGVNLPA